jgi:hypothetical protein
MPIPSTAAFSDDLQLRRFLRVDTFVHSNGAGFTKARGDQRRVGRTLTQLRVIAHELLNSLRSNASVDWQHHRSPRARMRVLVKRILRKYGYPPDLQDAAVQSERPLGPPLLR